MCSIGGGCFGGLRRRQRFVLGGKQRIGLGERKCE